MTLSMPLMIIGTIASLALFLCLCLTMVVRSLRAELQALRLKVEAEDKALDVKTSFSESLNLVERKAVTEPQSSGNNADRYRYVASLAQQGVDARGIAAALQMAPSEVEQLMQLARLKKQAQDVDH